MAVQSTVLQLQLLGLIGHSNSEKDCSLPPDFFTSPQHQIILWYHIGDVLSKSIQYRGDYQKIQKKGSEPHTILCFVPEIHGINQTNGAIAGHSLSSFQQGPVTFHAIHVSLQRGFGTKALGWAISRSFLREHFLWHIREDQMWCSFVQSSLLSGISLKNR